MDLQRLASRSDPRPGGYRDLPPICALHHLADLRVVDVREPDEYVGPLGHLPGAALVPVSTVAAAATDWDREAPLLLVCRSGARSARAATTLAGMGFRHLYNLVGGMLAWDASGLPRLRDDDGAVARLTAEVHGCFIAAAGGDADAGTRAFVAAAGGLAPSIEGLRRAVAALGDGPVSNEERVGWTTRFTQRLAEVQP